MTTEIDVPNPKLELIPGMYAYANLTLERKPNALAVPVLAIIHAGDETRVLRIDGHNRVEDRSVKIGIQTATKAEVLSGLSENDLVVTGQQAQLQPGQHVQPKLMQVEDFEVKGAQ
jgi:hypothetical protein